MGVMTQNGGAGTREGEQAQAISVPFVRASDLQTLAGGIDETRTLTSSQTELGVFDVPAYGYLAHIWLLVEATGGAAGLATVAAHEDAPFSVLRQIQLTEPNGSYIDNYVNGFSLYVANKYGGFRKGVTADPKTWSSFSAPDTDGNFSFALRIPVQLSERDGLGALANQDSAGQFKVQLSLAPSASVYTTAPDTLPSVRVRAYIEAWAQPETQAGGAVNQQTPPALGTTSFWTTQSGISVINGENTISHKRVGNFIRGIYYILRTSGSRATAETDYPEVSRLELDAFAVRHYQDDYWKDLMVQRTGFSGSQNAAGGLDDGVRFVSYMHEFDGLLGYENRDLWQQTIGSTRLELTGQFLAAASLDIMTNDVAVAENVFL